MKFYFHYLISDAVNFKRTFVCELYYLCHSLQLHIAQVCWKIHQNSDSKKMQKSHRARRKRRGISHEIFNNIRVGIVSSREPPNIEQSHQHHENVKRFNPRQTRDSLAVVLSKKNSQDGFHHRLALLSFIRSLARFLDVFLFSILYLVNIHELKWIHLLKCDGFAVMTIDGGVEGKCWDFEQRETHNFSDIDTTFVLIKLRRRRSISMNVEWSESARGVGEKGIRDPIRFHSLWRIIPATFHPAYLFSGSFTLLVTSENSEMLRRHENLFFLSRWAFLFLHFLCISKLIHRFVDFVIFSLGRFFKALPSSSCLRRHRQHARWLSVYVEDVQSGKLYLSNEDSLFISWIGCVVGWVSCRKTDSKSVWKWTRVGVKRWVESVSGVASCSGIIQHPAALNLIIKVL